MPLKRIHPEALTPDRIEAMAKAAGKNTRHRVRNELVIRMLYSHGLRNGELCNLRWSHIDILSEDPPEGEIKIHRLKRKDKARVQYHDLTPKEVKLLVRLRKRKEAREKANGVKEYFVFSSERGGGKLDPSAIFRIVQRAGKEVTGRHVHPHALRHACGYRLGNMEPEYNFRSISWYLGHKSLTSTVQYTVQRKGKFRKAFR